jgi:hypothetical protein
MIQSLDIVYDYCDRIKNDRTLTIIHESLLEEVGELDIEMTRHIEGKDCGEDGIVGESVDVALCAIDLAYKALERERKTHIEIKSIIGDTFKKKLDKWERIYG